jgi:hypothetical protein
VSEKKKKFFAMERLLLAPASLMQTLSPPVSFTALLAAYVFQNMQRNQRMASFSLLVIFIMLLSVSNCHPTAVVTFNSRSLTPRSSFEVPVSKLEFDQKIKRLQDQITAISLSVSKLSSNLEMSLIKIRTEDRINYMQLKTLFEQLRKELRRDSIPITTTDSSNLA